MKKILLITTIVIISTLTLCLVACGDKEGKDGSTAIELATPSVIVNQSNYTFTWTEVEGAEKYSVSINNGIAKTYTSSTSIDLSDKYRGTVSISVIAIDAKGNRSGVGFGSMSI